MSYEATMVEQQAEQALLDEWKAAAKRVEEEAKPLIDKERELRAKVFAFFFPAPKEGTNSLTLADGSTLKGKYPLSREVDNAVLTQMRSAVVGELNQMFRSMLNIAPDVPPDRLVCEVLMLNLDTLVRFKPELETKAYRTLTDEQRKMFDMCITTKPGSIGLELQAPKVTA